jgi:hypothetical protein
LDKKRMDGFLGDINCFTNKRFFIFSTPPK